jgi:hypothetical protein
MKIFFIPTSYPDEAHPTVNVFIYEQAKALAVNGHEVVILHLQKQPSKDILKNISGEISVHNDGFAKRYMLKIHTFLESKLHKINGAHFARCMEHLYNYVLEHEGRPDVIYAHFSFFAGYAAIKIAERMNVPVMVLEHYSGLMKKVITNAEISTLKYVIANRSRLCRLTHCSIFFKKGRCYWL